MYEIVFTNFRTGMDLVGKAKAETLITFIMNMIADGKWALTELRPIAEEAER